MTPEQLKHLNTRIGIITRIVNTHIRKTRGTDVEKIAVLLHAFAINVCQHKTEELTFDAIVAQFKQRLVIEMRKSTNKKLPS